MIISFSVEGTPAPKDYGASPRGWYIKKAPREWEKVVSHAAMAAAREADPQFKFGTYLGEVRLSMIFWLPIPKSDKSIKPGMPHCRKSKGDGANLYKSTEDALKRVLFNDDGAVSTATWAKRYAVTPHVDISCNLMDL